MTLSPGAGQGCTQPEVLLDRAFVAFGRLVAGEFVSVIEYLLD